MRRLAAFLCILIFTAAEAGCQIGYSAKLAPTAVETDACCQEKQPGLEETLAAAPDDPETAVPIMTGTAAVEPAVTITPLPSPAPVTDIEEAVDLDPGFLRQGAAYGSLEPYQLEDVAIGDYHPDREICGDSYLLTLPEESAEIILTLRYAVPILPGQIEVYTAGAVGGIRRIELLNETSGLGRLIYPADLPVRRESLTQGSCEDRLVVPVTTDFAVDTVLIALTDLKTAASIGAVEMEGELTAYEDVPIFWRVPLPSTPVDIAAGANGLVYVVTEPNGLYTYDVEGNQLKQFDTPSRSDLRAVAVDTMQNIVVMDGAYSRFIVLSPEGDQLVAGGQETFYHAAVSPADGNLYLLKSGTISVYTTDTAELLRKFPLDDLQSNGGLAFDPQGRLYTLRDHNWNATLLALDPLTGEDLDAIPLADTSQGEVVAQDIAVDGNGNIYVLFSMNTAEIAVHMLDARGNLIRRFGKLSNNPRGWPEGKFLDPRAITVSPDGRFILIADGFEDSAFLTAFLLEPE